MGGYGSKGYLGTEKKFWDEVGYTYKTPGLNML